MPKTFELSGSARRDLLEVPHGAQGTCRSIELDLSPALKLEAFCTCCHGWSFGGAFGLASVREGLVGFALPSPLRGPAWRRVLEWRGRPDPRGDSVPLRLAGGLHALVRRGRLPRPPSPIPATWAATNEPLRS